MPNSNNNNNNNNHSMEQDLLANMLVERDSQISTLMQKLHQTQDSLHSLQKELHQKSQQRQKQREEHSAAIRKLKEDHTEQRRLLAKYEQSVKNGGGLRVHEYAALMRSANQEQVESSYVIRLQAQLCRAMHSLGVMESQLALVKDNCSSLIKHMKEDLSHMVDDRTRREIELMNGLANVDMEKRNLQEEMEAKLREKEELLNQVREEFEELGLEYDEKEVKMALEVKILEDTIDKVEKEKVRVEKELIQSMLERDEQIKKLREENEGLSKAVEALQNEKAEAEGKKRDKRGDASIGKTPSQEDAQKEQADDNGGEGEDDKVETDNLNEVASQLQKQSLEDVNPAEVEPNPKSGSPDNCANNTLEKVASNNEIGLLKSGTKSGDDEGDTAGESSGNSDRDHNAEDEPEDSLVQGTSNEGGSHDVAMKEGGKKNGDSEADTVILSGSKDGDRATNNDVATNEEGRGEVEQAGTTEKSADTNELNSDTVGKSQPAEDYEKRSQEIESSDKESEKVTDKEIISSKKESQTQLPTPEAASEVDEESDTPTADETDASEQV
mmetsp:Transcript_15462/g.31394  ORF Transcript_15462/g.31394 Transcript_15462/m.31394 type:complete len:556 (-) Transcript_15462:225-1892(-)